MSARVRLARDESGAIAIKVAHSPEDVVALRYEIDLLQRASHPGLVATIDGRDDSRGQPELRTRYAGEALTRWRGTLPGAVGLGAAIAATLADLHAQGLVHGRLDSTHVLVGADGRPRLCGFAPPDGRTPADDVASLAEVISELADRATSTDARWAVFSRRSAIADRRALADVLRRARHPEPTRRLSARSLATALLAAVPNADLPRRDPPLDDPAPGSPSVRHPRRSSPADDETSGASIDNPTQSAPGLRNSATRRTAAPAPEDENLRPSGEHGPRTGPPRTHGWPGVASGPEGEDLGISCKADAEVLRGHEVGGTGDADDRMCFGFGQLLGGQLGSVGDDPVFGDQTTAELEEVFVDRPWPAAPALPRPAPRSRHRTAVRRPGSRRRVTTSALLALGLVVAGAAVMHVGRPIAAGRSAVASIESTPPTDCDPTVSATPADIDGDGCADDVRIERGVIEASGQRWQVGDETDAVAVADWNCDGTATPALYRPDTGDVFVFPSWASAELPVTVAAIDTVTGGLGLAPADGPCPALAVDMPTGEHHSIEVSR